MHGGFFTALFCMSAWEAGHDLSQHSALCAVFKYNQGSTVLPLQFTIRIEVQEVSVNPWFKKEAMAVKT